jgi:hypothetical protein
MGVKLGHLRKWESQIEGIWEKGVEENIWNQRRMK